MRLTTDERRAHPRRELIRPCKVRLGTTGKYVAGHTRDISSGGSMLVLDRRSNLAPGDEIEVGVAWDNTGLIRGDGMLRGRVVRVAARTDQTEAIGVALDIVEQDVSLAA